jgi:hypothetical protein
MPQGSLLTRVVLAAACSLLSIASPLPAQAPGVGHTFPAGAPAGSTIEVQLGGYDFTPDVDFFLHQSTATLKTSGPLGRLLVAPPPYWFGPKGRTTAFKIPRELTATFTLPSDLPRGPIHWQVANANGASGTAVFFVGDGPEVLESRRQSEAQSLSQLPVTVNGRLSRITEVDLYALTATADGCLSVELYARRLGANFNGTLKVRDARGALLADVIDTRGEDCAATVSVKKGQRYTVEVADLDHRGHRSFVYRLELTPGPRLVTSVPSGGKPGTTAAVTFIGYGIKTGTARLESVVSQVTFPANTSGRGWFDYRLKTPFGQTPPLALPLDDLLEIVEPVTGGDRTLAHGTAVTGRLARPDEVDEYTLEAKAGQLFRLEAVSTQIGTRLDPVLSVLDAKDKQLALNDDFGGTLDAGLDFKAPADGTYRVRVHNGTGVAGRIDSVYRLTVAIPLPGFALSMPQFFVAPVGGKAPLTLSCTRTGGFNEEIVVTLGGLPAGVKVPAEIKIPKGKPSVKFDVEVAATSGTDVVFLTATGNAMVDKKPLSVKARSRFSGNLVARKATARFDNRMLLVRKLDSPVTLELIDRNRQRPVHRGTTYPADFIVKRDKGYTGAIRVRMAATQQRRVQGMQGPVLKVPDGAAQVQYPCFMPEWLETDRTTRMIVHSVAIVADAKGRKRHIIKASTGSITMILEGALLKLAHRAGELTVSPGGSFEIPVSVARSAKLQETTTVRIEPPEALKGLIKAQTLTLKPGQKTATLKVMTLPDDRLSGDWEIKLVATALQDGRWPAVSITMVPIRFQAATP